MLNESGNNTNSNLKNKFPNQGNFSALQNNVRGQQNNITNNQNSIENSKQKKIGNDAEIAAKALTGGNPIAGKVAKELANSKLGNKFMNATSKKSINPMNPTKGLGLGTTLGGLFSKNEEPDSESNDTESEQPKSAQSEIQSSIPIPKEVQKKLIPAVAIGGLGCLGSLFLIVIIASVILAPVMYINKQIVNIKNGLTNFWNSIVAFFSGCENKETCQEDKFYKELLNVHKEYEGEPYYITLNTELITATLTYTEPMEAFENIGKGTSVINYKKGRDEIDELAKKMVGEGKQCVDSLGTIIEQYKENEKKDCPKVNPNNPTYYANEKDKKNNKTTQNEVKEKKWYYLDEEKYRNYLIYGERGTGFIEKFYFKGKNPTSKQIEDVVNDIYSRVEMVSYLNSSENTSTNFTVNNSNVLIMNCSGNMELETISLYEYLQGVLYSQNYGMNYSTEFLKVQAVTAKNYLYSINGATPDSIPTTLRINNCQKSQVYCSVTDGCYNMNDGNNVTYDSNDTISTGSGSNGGYFIPPIKDVGTLEKIKSAIDITLNDFVVSDGKFVITQSNSTCTNMICDSTTNILDQQIANNMITDGKTYQEVLNYFYNGELQEVTLGSSGYPLDLIHNKVTSAFGWRVHPTKKVCQTHGGTDIAAPSDANIYSIADGVVVTVGNMPSTINGYGYYMIIGHGNYVNGYYEYYSLYAHQIKMPLLSEGDTVKIGQQIGNVGSTGASTGPHLHIEIYSYVNGKKIKQDPVEYFKGVELIGHVGGALYSDSTSCNACVNTYGIGKC